MYNNDISNLSISSSNTIDNLKDSILKDLKSYKTHKKKKDKGIYNSNSIGLTQKQKLENYFNQIKHTSKLDISGLSATNNVSEKANEPQNDAKKNDGFIIYESFKNMMNKGKLSFKSEKDVFTLDPDKNRSNTNSQRQNFSQMKYTTHEIDEELPEERFTLKVIPERESNDFYPISNSSVPQQNFTNFNFNNEKSYGANGVTANNNFIHNANSNFNPTINTLKSNDNFLNNANNNSPNKYLQTDEQISLISDIKNLKIESNNRVITAEQVTQFSMLTESNFLNPKKEQKKKNKQNEKLYKTQYFSLKRRFTELKIKLIKQKKVNEMLNLKLFYETHKDSQTKGKIEVADKVKAQLEDNIKMLSLLQSEIIKKDKIINDQREQLAKQKEIISSLTENFSE